MENKELQGVGGGGPTNVQVDTPKEIQVEKAGQGVLEDTLQEVSEGTLQEVQLEKESQELPIAAPQEVQLEKASQDVLGDTPQVVENVVEVVTSSGSMESSLESEKLNSESELEDSKEAPSDLGLFEGSKGDSNKEFLVASSSIKAEALKSEMKRDNNLNHKQFSFIHMAIFGVVVLLLVIGTDLVRDNLGTSKQDNVLNQTVSQSGDLGQVVKDNVDIPADGSGTGSSLPFLETPEVLGYKTILECGHELVISKQQVQDRLDRDLEVVRNALEMTEEEFELKMEQIQIFEDQETSEITLFMMNSLEYYKFEVYIDHLIEEYKVVPTQEEKDELLNSYLASFEELEAEGYSIDELFMLEFGMDFDTWVVEELEITVARQILVDHIPVDNFEIEKEATEGYNIIGDFAKIKHILVDTREEADRIYNLIVEGAEFEDFLDVTKDPGGIEYEFVKGDMVEEFENWAFAAQEGDLEIVETQYGYHIMRSLGVTEGVSEVHRTMARQYIADDIVYKGFMATNWEILNE